MKTTICGYEPTEKLYESPSSLVYRTREKKGRPPTILKILKPEYASAEEPARYRREYDLARSLSDEGIIQVYGLESDSGRPVLLVEDFGGRSLDYWLKERTFSPQECLTLAIRITEGLGLVHGADIIHKDINPSNIVWNPQTGQVKIIDFGIATRLARETATFRGPEELEGTPAYLSPEQTGRMNRLVDYHTDFYSLGTTLYELLTDQRPFAGEDALALVHAHIAKMPPAPHQLNPEIPEAVSMIVMKLLAKNAEDRYQSAAGLEHDLSRCMTTLKETGGVEVFEPGLMDFSTRFQVPQKLYGRKKETAQLLAAFDEIVQGVSKLFLVAGYSGVGKTVLVREVHKPITGKRGYFIEGKFDQFQRNIPYFAWGQAFNGMMNQLLMESEDSLAAWKARILEAVGRNGRVLTDVVPNLELVIGPQPDVPELGGVETQNRFNYVFQNFIKVMAQ
ncbi:MAG: AAA family ATPase [Candidatus Thiodiazotropha sp. (ex Dulcina madagascariensis)]|nr:AAA family ATPase [Candidatus Thiodiazotropha sp. (ex Dulcina madagascariensis)]